MPPSLDVFPAPPSKMAASGVRLRGGRRSHCCKMVAMHDPSPPMSNDSWVFHAGGDVVEKQAKMGLDSLSDRERLLYWLWWVDYMMRSAGDFENAVCLKKDFQEEIVTHAARLGCRYTQETFALPRATLQKEYFDRFDAVCDEIRRG